MLKSTLYKSLKHKFKKEELLNLCFKLLYNVDFNI
jgi:hypothetical protein